MKLKPEKIRLERDSNPGPLRYRCSAVPTELSSQLHIFICRGFTVRVIIITFNLKPFCLDFIFRSSKPQSNDKFHDQGFKENRVAMDMTDNDACMKTSTLPNFSLGFDFLWEVTSTKSESEEGRNCTKDNAVTFFKQRNENCIGSVYKHNGAGFPNFTKITQHSGHNSDISCQQLRVQHTENKVNVKQMLCSTSEPTKAVPRKVTNSNISNGHSVVSDQSWAFNKSLATQNKSSSHNANAQAKLQVVTPSCRPDDVGTRPAISPLLTVRIKSLL